MGKILLRGILGIAPIAITVTILVWLYNELEYIFGTPIQYFFPEIYFQGIGIIFAVIVLFFVGWVLNHWIIQHFYNWMEAQLKRIPLLKTIYTAVTDLMSFFQAGKNQEKGKVVFVHVGGVKFMGIVTRHKFHDLPDGIGSDDEVLVFIPTSYQIGGYTCLVPKSQIEPIDFTVEKALRFCATAGSPGAVRKTFTPERSSFRKKS